MTGRRDRRPAPAVAAVAVLVLALLVLPVFGLLWRAPWSAAWTTLREPAVRTALWLSLVCSLSAAAIAMAGGVPLAWVLARFDFPGRRIVRAAALVPLVLPPVVGGVALLLAFGRRGVAGRWLYDWIGIQLPFSTAGAALAAAFVALPFVVVTAEAAFRNLDRRYEDAARTLGAGGWFTFRRVTLPLVWPSLAAGAALAWARALGEFGATITFAGNAPGRTTTVPLEVYVLIESGDAEAAVVLSIVLLGVSIAVLAALREQWFGVS